MGIPSLITAILIRYGDSQLYGKLVIDRNEDYFSDLCVDYRWTWGRGEENKCHHDSIQGLPD